MINLNRIQLKREKYINSSAQNPCKTSKFPLPVKITSTTHHPCQSFSIKLKIYCKSIMHFSVIPYILANFGILGYPLLELQTVI